MVGYQVYFTKQADKDKKLIKQAGLENKARDILKILALDPLQNPPPYEKLIGNLNGYYSRRINLQHRLVYEVLDNTNQMKDINGELFRGHVKIIRMWTHYSDIR